MTSSTPKDGMYFDRDIEMTATALIEMFGEDAPLYGTISGIDEVL